MNDITAFADGRATSALLTMCAKVGVRPEIVRKDVFESIRSLVQQNHHDMKEYDLIRYVYAQLKEVTHVKSNLAVYFGEKMSTISKILSDPKRGHRECGRPRKLTSEQEETVVAYVRACQYSGNCVTCSQLTEWINEVILQRVETISRKFIQHNRVIMEHFEIVSPRTTEELRVEACTYDVFREFFTSTLESLLAQHPYDSDFIISVDSRSPTSDKTKSSTKVIYDPSIDIPPMVRVAARDVALCCAVAASGNALMPTILAKNESYFIDNSMISLDIFTEDFAVATTSHGWRDARVVRLWLEKILLSYRTKLQKPTSRVLLLVDAHDRQAFECNSDYCTANNVDVCYLPPFTSHILQPLFADGVFSSYKTAYRRAVKDNCINVTPCRVTVGHAKEKCVELGRALMSNLQLSRRHIQRGFCTTGVCPFSFESFMANCSGVKNLPPDVLLRTNEIIV